MEKQFELIGYNIQNSASPFIHTEIFKHFNKNYTYKIADIKPEHFANYFSRISTLNGINITTPYKIQAFKQLTNTSENAKQFGCVNTIKIENNQIKGYCTDNTGFLQTLSDFKCNFFNNVLIIGFGGAGQMAAHCLAGKCSNLFVLIRNLAKIKHSKLNIKFVQLKNILNLNFDLIVNASTCGNSNCPNLSPINLNCLGNVSNVFDLIYYPPQTKLLKQAQQLGAKTINGIKMLVLQAVESQKIWNDFNFSNDFVKALIKKTTNFLKAKSL